jgi:hypothetical protein
MILRSSAAPLQATGSEGGSEPGAEGGGDAGEAAGRMAGWLPFAAGGGHFAEVADVAWARCALSAPNKNFLNPSTLRLTP